MNPKKQIPIMLCFDSNYVIPAGVAMYSLLKHANPNYEYLIYVCHTDISATAQQKLKDTIAEFPNARFEFINMQGRFDQEFKALKTQGHYSKEVLYKLLVASLFPQHDRIIVTDVDVVFTGDIMPHYLDLESDDDFIVAGVRPILPRGSNMEHFYECYKKQFSEQEVKNLSLCGGYLIFNLKEMRHNNCEIEQQFLQCLKDKAKYLKQAEQDVLNLVVPENKKRFMPLAALVCSYFYDMFVYDSDYDTDPHYSAQELRDAMRNPIQLHYAMPKKPWRNPDVTKTDVWFEYLLKTPFANEWLENLALFVTERKGEQQKRFVKLFSLPTIFRRKFTFWVSRHLRHRPKPTDKITVVCLTYNQIKYIKNTLDGFVRQRVNIPVEYIISDDGSTDGTADIIREYATKYPDIIKPVLHKDNRGPALNAFSVLQKIATKFVAWCDGDDCWTDELKLQKQLNILRKYPECNVVCSNVKWHYADNSQPDTVFKVREYMPRHMAKKSDFTFDDLLNCRFIASCTTMLRWQFRPNEVPNWLKNHVVVDFPVFLIHAHNATIRVLDEDTATYTISSAGVSQASQTLEYKQKMQKILRYVDHHLNFEHTDSINAFISKNRG